jgi:flagellar biosynthesis protein FlhF
MQMIRDTLGENAIIVSTREENGGRTVRVTAAIDEDTEATMPTAPGSLAEAAMGGWQYADDDDEATVVEEITEVMLRHAVPDEVLDDVVAAVNVMGLTESRNALYAALQNLFEFKPLPQKTYGKAFMVVGAPGAGKTLAAAKLAARGALAGLKVGVVTTDTVRAGGVEQLSAFTKLMKIDLKKASDPKELKAVLASMGQLDQIIIDTAGVNPFDPESIKPLARLIHAAEADPVLVLPAGSDADEAGEIARVFATIGATSMIATRTDVARRLGSLLSAAHHGGLSFAEVSNTAKVADGLAPMSAKRLTQLLMPRAENAAALANARKAG